MDWLITIVLGGVIILYLFWRSLSHANYWKKRGIPHVKSLPLIGNTLDVILMKKTFGELIHEIYKEMDGHKFVGYMQFMSPVLVVRDPELIGQVMIKEFGHFHDRGLPMSEKFEPLSGNLVNLTGDRWREVRHKLTPTFTSGKLKMMFDQIVECSDEALDYLRGKTEAIEVKQFMQRFNLNVIGLVAFGLNVDALNSTNEKSNMFVKQSTNFFAPSLKTLFCFLIRISFPRLGKLLRVRTMKPEITEFFLTLVKDTIEFREKNNIRRNDFIQLMLDLKHHEQAQLTNQSTDHKAHHPLYKDEHLEAEDKELLEHLNNAPIRNESETPVFTDVCIAAQSFIFISGGSETTATVLTFAIYQLAANLEVQERLQKEVDAVLTSHAFDYHAIKEIAYLEQFIYEVMRMHPPGGAIGRVCTEDFVLPGTDKVIEKGTLVHIPVVGLHKDPKFFPDPETFNPDRFSDMKAIPKGAFLPFGDGPRICIAMRLAMLEMKIFLAKLVTRYNVTLNEKTQLPLKMAPNSIVLNVVGGMWVNFEERQ